MSTIPTLTDEVDDTTRHFARGLREAFPQDYRTSAVESEVPPHKPPVHLIRALASAVLIVGVVLAISWFWARP